MKTSDFDFELPESLIALEPARTRDSSRLMVLHPDGSIDHKLFSDLPDYLHPGDMLVLNKTKVLPVRLFGKKPDGGVLEITLVKPLGDGRWEILSRGKYTGPVEVSSELRTEVEGGSVARLIHSGDLDDILWKAGHMPLPPYIKRAPTDMDKLRYQTVYASEPGSIAAPTAGLHFTEGLIDEIEKKDVAVRYLSLSVGTGTFTPLRAETVEEHEMASESFEIERSLIEDIRAHKGRLVAVGTTTTRTLEGFFSGHYIASDGEDALNGSTDIFIYPGYRFRAVSSLLTNFHLPRSTPLMLTAALAGRERLLRAYKEAIEENYRFFSYGDAMLIL
jgi:S-adenosylmethionine:tRNA ribosyltransferase-isomerase